MFWFYAFHEIKSVVNASNAVSKVVHKYTSHFLRLHFIFMSPLLKERVDEIFFRLFRVAVGVTIALDARDDEPDPFSEDPDISNDSPFSARFCKGGVEYFHYFTD